MTQFEMPTELMPLRCPYDGGTFNAHGSGIRCDGCGAWWDADGEPTGWPASEWLLSR